MSEHHVALFNYDDPEDTEPIVEHVSDTHEEAVDWAKDSIEAFEDVALRAYAKFDCDH